MATTLRKMMQADAVPEPSVSDLKKIRSAVAQLLALQEEVEQDLKLVAEKSKRVRTLAEQTIPTMLDEAGVESITVDGNVIKVITEYHPEVLVANREKFYKWLRENNFGSLIKTEVVAQFGMGEDKKAIALTLSLLKRKYDVVQKQSVHSSTLKAFVKEQLEKEHGITLPSILDPNPIRTTTVRSKGK